MKTLLACFCLGVLGCALSTLAQSVVSSGSEPHVSEYVITERGAHHRVWERVSWEASSLGTRVARTNAYTELASGLNYPDPDTGEWRESREEFELTPEGYAVARQGQHKVIISPVLNDAEGAVDLETPDGRRLRSTVLALALYNRATGQSLWLAEVSPDAEGRLVSPNEVQFADAFQGFACDLRYVYRRGDFRQEVLPREQVAPETLAAAGFPLADSVLEIWTEFHEAPEPVIEARVIHREANPVRRTAMVEPDLISEDLDFGALKLPSGRAYLKGRAESDAEPVNILNRWRRLEGRVFLVESIPLDQAENLFAHLPTGDASDPPFEGRALYAGRRAPLPALARQESRTILMAQSGSRPGEGVELVMDYVTVNGNVTNLVLAGDQTYYVSGPTYVYGAANVLEGGAVVKYAKNADAQLRYNSPLECRTAPYRPAVFTAKDDDTVGQTISGSSGNPSGYYPYAAMSFFNKMQPVVLHDLRVSYANYGLLIPWGGPYAHVIRNSQFVRNYTGVYVDYTSVPTTLQNVLLHRSGLRAVYGYEAIVCGENLTIHEAYRAFDGGTVSVTNSLLVAVTNWPTAFTSVNNVTNASGAGVFQTVGAGAHYLVDGSTNRNAGTTNINADLLADLGQRTTYPPVVLSNVTITASTNLLPQAQRDTDIPDRGYHYDPIDVLMNSVNVTNATMSLTNGAVMAVYGVNSGAGLRLRNGAQFVSEGAPLNLNRIVQYSSVQERGPTNWPATTVGQVIQGDNNTEARFRFTMFAGAQSYGEASVALTDCQFFGGSLSLMGTDIGLTNCLLERVFMPWLLYDSHLFFRNNLSIGGLMVFELFEGSTASVRDSFFQDTGLWDTGGLAHTHNAYTTGTFWNGSTNYGPNDVILSDFTFIEGPLGRYYQLSTNLLNVGSVTNAELVGLYHYTTTTNQVKEGNSWLDIGLHYMALDNLGYPVDSDDDGLPDYLEDSDGDGLPDGWELQYFGNLNQTGSGDYDSDGVSNLMEYLLGRNPLVGATGDAGDQTKLRVFTPLK
ncbi:MAG: hypothetical protein KIS67_06370 [Verrucomicrobiae bacterium]|nr:hypothetical protein [Verrucomicrobiae bacterium]